MSWHIALLEYLSTPLSANIPSPSELIGRQFRGLLPFFQDHSTSESIKEQVLILQEKEKQRHNTSAYDLPVIPVWCYSKLSQQRPENLGLLAKLKAAHLGLM